MRDPSAPLVSVIVPVFNPGTAIEALIASLLQQTLPARELVFVDDGSSDGTGERLDRLSRRPDVTVVHTQPSGWPGRPRNIGLELSCGEFVFFADNDDWFENDALERLSAVALAHDADIVIGRVVGAIGRRIPRMFPRDIHGLDAANVPLGLLTPHKLFRRELLDRHAIRFPEGERRLEDHLFVVPAFFAAERISLLSSRPVYHWTRRAGSASSRRSAPDAHFAAVRTLIGIVNARTEPGPVRDRYHLHWYRGKVLRRLGRWSDGDESGYRAAVYDAARALIDECFPPRLDERLPFNLRLRAALVRRDRRDAVDRLQAFEQALRARARVRKVEYHGAHMRITVAGRLRCRGRRAFRVRRVGAMLVWLPPEQLAHAWPERERDVVGELEQPALAILRERATGLEWSLPVTASVRIPGAPNGVATPRVVATVTVDAATGAAGAPLTAGTYELRVVFVLAGFSGEGVAAQADGPLSIVVRADGTVATNA